MTCFFSPGRVCFWLMLGLFGSLPMAAAAPANTPAGWTLLRVHILDDEGKPVDGFTCEYTLKSQQETSPQETVTSSRGQHGEIEFSAPAECEIIVSIEHPDVVHGFGTELVLQRHKGATEMEAKFRFGHRVTGQVVDAATGQAVAGAKVMPLMFTPPGQSPDKTRSVTTGNDGAFALRGVERAFAVEHPSFIEQQVYLDEKDIRNPQTVKLQAGETIHGSITDADHRPLAGVGVSDGSGKDTTTDKDGRFTLSGLRKWSGDEWALDFVRPEYNDKHLRTARIDPAGLVIQLDPLPQLRGTVVLPDGAPATEYQLVCAPGPHPVDYKIVKVEVQDKDGRFNLRPESLPETGTDYWIGVRAEEMAPWDGLVSMDQLTRGNFRIALEIGSTLSATFKPAGPATGSLQVTLVPTDRKPEESFVVTEHPGSALASSRAQLDPGEPLRFDHLRPGNYLLAVQGKGITPVSRPVVIGKSDLDLGEVALPGVGSVSGVVHEPYRPDSVWRFADGEIYLNGFGSSREPLKKFRTDAQGRFQVDDVPSGEITVAFSYAVSPDVGDSVWRRARIVAGQDTEIRLEGAGGGWTQPVRLLFDGKSAPPAYSGARKVGNVTDRPAAFRLEVTPLFDGPCSGPGLVEWDVKEDSPGPDVPDLSPGRWRIRVYDWLGSRGFGEGLRAETTAEVSATKRLAVSIELGSHTLSGKVSTAASPKRLVAVQAVSKSTGRMFHSRCDDTGNFVIRYLPVGDYAVHAHDDDAGWCDLGTFRLDGPLVDCGEHRLDEGGSAVGVLSGGPPSPAAEGSPIRAIAPDGVEILVDEVTADGGYRFGGMRSGPWVLHFGDGRLSADRSVEIQRGKTVNVSAEKGVPTARPGSD